MKVHYIQKFQDDIDDWAICGVLYWESESYNIDEVTCKRCLQKYNKDGLGEETLIMPYNEIYYDKSKYTQDELIDLYVKWVESLGLTSATIWGIDPKFKKEN